MDKHTLDLIRCVLMTIRYGDSAKSQRAEEYLYGFAHCAHYVAGLISRDAYDTIKVLMGNAADNHMKDRVRKSV